MDELVSGWHLKAQLLRNPDQVSAKTVANRDRHRDYYLRNREKKLQQARERYARRQLSHK